MNPQAIQKLIAIFSKFPTVGQRTAARFVYYLIGLKKEESDELIKAILDLRKNIKTCSLCFNPFEGPGNLCQICADPMRDKSVLCIVEKELDLNSIEKIKKYRGKYFILGGTISRLKRSEIEKLRMKELASTIKNGNEIKEVIIAINPTAEGETTILYLERMLKPYAKKVTKLGLGLPLGGELEYADEETLSSALERRR